VYRSSDLVMTSAAATLRTAKQYRLIIRVYFEQNIARPPPSIAKSVFIGANLWLKYSPMIATRLIVLAVSFSLAAQTVFKDVAEQVGLRFQHYNGMTGKFYLPEITGSGAALFDFDNDGDLDVFLVQGNVL